MSDILTPFSPGIPTVTSVNASLTAYNQRGLSARGESTAGNVKNIVIDTVTLSAEAQRLISSGGAFLFPARADGLKALVLGTTAFVNVDLSGAALIGQRLDGALFSNAVLKDVNFTATSLRGARFEATLVEGARFNQADLTGADLTGAQGLLFTQIQGATFDETTALPAGIGNAIL